MFKNIIFNSFSPKKSGCILFFIVLFIILVFGILMRIHALLNAHNIFYDEAALLINIKERAYAQLFLPLDHNQCCPPLFLIWGKFIFEHFGLNLIAIRSLPFISSLISLILFIFLSLKIFKSRIAILTACFMFAFSPWLLTYTMFFKQYICDVAISVLLLLVAYYLKDRLISKLQVVLLALLSILCVLMSYTAVIIIASVFITLAVYKYNKEDCKEWLKKIILFIGIWGIFLIVYYIVNMKSPMHYGEFHSYWKILTGTFYPKTIEKVFDIVNIFTGSMSKPAAALILASISIIFLAVKDRYTLCLVFLPLIFAVILALLKKYPFVPERVILYLIPLFLILLTKFLDYIAEIINKHNRQTILILLVAFFVYSLNIPELQRVTGNLITQQYTNITDHIYKSLYKKEKTSNVENALKMLKLYGIKKSDYILIKYADYLVYNLYDKENLVNLDNIITDNRNIPINSTVYMYISEEYDDYKFFKKFLKGCKIELIAKDGDYNLIKAVKI